LNSLGGLFFSFDHACFNDGTTSKEKISVTHVSKKLLINVHPA